MLYRARLPFCQFGCSVDATVVRASNNIKHTINDTHFPFELICSNQPEWLSTAVKEYMQFTKGDVNYLRDNWMHYAADTINQHQLTI